MTTKTTVEILREARAILETNGLNKGSYVDREYGEVNGVAPEQCPVCVYGAMNLASGRDVDYDESGSIDDAERLLVEVFRPGALAHSLSLWNDLPTTTLEDVLWLLDKAIARAEQPVLASDEQVLWLAAAVQGGAA